MSNTRDPNLSMVVHDALNPPRRNAATGNSEMKAFLANIIRDKIFYATKLSFEDSTIAATEAADAITDWDLMVYEGAVYRVVEANVADTEDDRVVWHVLTEQ